MRHVPQILTDTWLGGDFIGDRRPIARVTLQKLAVSLTKVDPTRLFASAIFNQADIPREMPNVKSVQWQRAIGTDVATATIVFYNTAPLPLGQLPVSSGDFDLPGYYSFNYGASGWSSGRWGTTANKWQDYLVPDRLLRTYEGYGFDKTKIPEKDPHLVQTGLWMIDDVEYSNEGLITVTCRDLGRLLLDHIMFPPVIPLAKYPMEWEPIHLVDGSDVVSDTNFSYRPTYLDDSGKPYYGKNASIHGHKPSDAFDDSGDLMTGAKNNTYWLSIGNAVPNAGYSYEWIEGNCSGNRIAMVQYKVYGGPYRVYLSVKIKNVWQGSKLIPYDPDNPVSAPNGANIPYSMVHTVSREGTGTFRLNHPIANVDAIRLTFTSLFNSGIGPYKYRAGVRSVRCHYSIGLVGPGPKVTQGNYSDYTDIVKYLLACGGFYWPKPAAMAYFTLSDGTHTALAPTKNDTFLTQGRVWGDLEQSGTTSYASGTYVNKLEADVWDKKPLMDGIAFIRDTLGFVFFIDETGGAVWRLPNLYQVGNFVGDTASDAGYQAGAGNVITIDERQTLLGLRAKISSKNIREFDLVGNAAGTFGAAAQGYNPISPNPGLRRLAIWTDQNFLDVTECQKMADMMSQRRAMTYRTNSVTILANPAIQIDDQVQLYERLSGEGYVHYVTGITSNNDLETGRWNYDLTTNWLGETPFGVWAVDRAALSAETQEFLDAIIARRATAHGFYLLGGGKMVMSGKVKK